MNNIIYFVSDKVATANVAIMLALDLCLKAGDIITRGPRVTTVDQLVFGGLKGIARGSQIVIVNPAATYNRHWNIYSEMLNIARARGIHIAIIRIEFNGRII